MPTVRRGAADAITTCADLLAAGLPAHSLDGVVEARISHLQGPHLEAVLAGEETPDLPRLAALAAAEGFDLDEAFYPMLRDVDDAIFDVEHRLVHPEPGDNPLQLKREIRRLNAVRNRRELELSDTLAQADYALDATLTYAAAAPAETIKRPTVSYGESVAAVEQAVAEAFDGAGPRHRLIIASCGTRKTHHAVVTAARHAAQRREERREWLRRFHRDNPGTSRADALTALNREGPRPFRVLYLGERHKQVRDAVNLARQHGMLAEHHGGYDRGFDPADEDAPAVCTQPARRKATEQAGESVPDIACGRAEGAKPCPDLAGCARWSRLTNCARVEFNGTTIDYATGTLPRQLRDNDLVIIDEVPDRALFHESAVPLDYLSDRHFITHPVRDEAGEPDEARTELARAENRLFRDVLDSNEDGYVRAALRDAGFDDARLTKLVELTNARDAPSGMTSATPDKRRTELAAASFRRQISALCGMFRQLAEPGDGWVRIEGDGEQRRAIVRRINALHQSILEGRVLALDGSGDLSLASWRTLIPDIVPIAIPVPHAPYETAVQIVRPNGKHAMRRPERLAYDQAIQRLYSHGQVGVLTHKEHEEAFVQQLGTVTGHFMATAGSNEWLQCSTMLTFGLPFIAPEVAAHEAAGRTGEPVEPTMPVRTLRRVAMRDGGMTLVPSMEYQHPAAREAQAAVRDRQAMQGPGGRPRGAMRDADNPVLSIYVGTSPIPGKVMDYVLSGPQQLAPDRFVRMVAADLAVASGPDRHRMHPEIYTNPRTAEYDMPREAGGYLVTLQRVLYPEWWGDRPRAAWITLRYWVKGRGNRSDGRIAACPIGRIAWAKNRLRDSCRAVRIEIAAEVHRPRMEVPRMGEEDDFTWILGTLPRIPPGSLFGDHTEPDEASWRVDHPPDG